MGEMKKPALRMEFNWKLKLEFHGAKITSDAGLIAYREMDHTLGLTAKASEYLEDYSTGKDTQYSLLGMLRQSVYGRLAGYEDVNDADRLRHDPAMKTLVGERNEDKSVASRREMGRFETAILS